MNEYIGSKQQGDHVGLMVQCMSTAMSPTVPSSSPSIRVYKLGIGLVASGLAPVDADPESSGLFRRRLRLSESTSSGRYAVVYQYGASSIVRSELSPFEVSPGGDHRGPVVSAFLFDRPSRRTLLAQSSSGLVLRGDEPYTDEGVST